MPRYRPAMLEQQNEIGIATGLAWTEAGGELLFTESTLMPGKGRLTLTGQLGDVIQESAKAAMSYVRSRAEEFGIQKDFHHSTDIHVHVPEGAIPKGRAVGRHHTGDRAGVQPGQGGDAPRRGDDR